MSNKLNNYQQLDYKNIWHPYTSLYQPLEHIVLSSAKDEFLIDLNGKKYIDAVSSWWVNIHGHGHPELNEVLADQFKTLDHSIFAGFTHVPAIEYSEKILNVFNHHFSKIFFSDNGSTAVEVAIKMALQYRTNQHLPIKKILAIDGAYHGDTFGAMSVSARSTFTQAFKNYLFEVDFIDFPTEKNIQSIIEKLESNASEYGVFIFEPLVQGAAGMRIYSAECLNKLLQFCNNHQIVTIADEVMTGFGRTGKLFASEYLQLLPDIICLSKGITGGVLPLGATLCTTKIEAPFNNPSSLNTLYHGHSFTGNPLTIALANKSLEILLRFSTLENIQRISEQHKHFVNEIKPLKFIKNVESIGTIVRIEFETPGEQTGYFNSIRNKLYNYYLAQGVLLRPLGNIIYIIPPYCTSDTSLQQIYNAIKNSFTIINAN